MTIIVSCSLDMLLLSCWVALGESAFLSLLPRLPLYCRYWFIQPINVRVSVQTWACACEHGRLVFWAGSGEYDTLCHSQFLVLQQVGYSINNGWQRERIRQGSRVVHACQPTCPFIKIQQSINGHVFRSTCVWDGKLVSKYLYLYFCVFIQHIVVITDVNIGEISITQMWMCIGKADCYSLKFNV